MNRKNNLSTHIKAFMSLFWINLFLDELVEVDFQKALFSNKQLASSQNLHKHEFRQKLRKNTIDRVSLLRKRLILSLLWILSACCIASLAFSLFSRNICLAPFLISSNIVVLFSIVSFSWATLGRLGWEGQSWKGDTVFEQLDNLIFWFLYWLGTLFGTLAFLV